MKEECEQHRGWEKMLKSETDNALMKKEER